MHMLKGKDISSYDVEFRGWTLDVRI